jgi:hypothetical protein
LKLGGELLERPEDLKRVAAGIAKLSERSTLVVVQVALALVLLVSSGLMIRSSTKRHSSRVWQLLPLLLQPQTPKGSIC